MKSLSFISSDANITMWLGRSDQFPANSDTKPKGSIMNWSDSSTCLFSSLFDQKTKRGNTLFKNQIVKEKQELSFLLPWRAVQKLHWKVTMESRVVRSRMAWHEKENALYSPFICFFRQIVHRILGPSLLETTTFLLTTSRERERALEVIDSLPDGINSCIVPLGYWSQVKIRLKVLVQEAT